jgi:hypothetical protein
MLTEPRAAAVDHSVYDVFWPEDCWIASVSDAGLEVRQDHTEASDIAPSRSFPEAHQLRPERSR